MCLSREIQGGRNWRLGASNWNDGSVGSIARLEWIVKQICGQWPNVRILFGEDSEGMP